MRALFNGLAAIAVAAAAGTTPSFAQTPGDDIARGSGALGRTIGDLISRLVNMKDDNPKREKFVQDSLGAAGEQFPGYNIVIVHVDHTVSPAWGGPPWGSSDYFHQHYEFQVSFGTIGYEFYFVKMGKPFDFTRKGDGGWINWGWSGNFSWDQNTNTLHAPVYSVGSDAGQTAEIVYLSNCKLSDGQQSSEMNYYASTSKSQHGELPAATAQVAHHKTVTWEGITVVGTFPDDNHFTSKITDHNGPIGSVKGSGANDFHSFTCRQDSYRELYSQGGKVCNSVYYCQP